MNMLTKDPNCLIHPIAYHETCQRQHKRTFVMHPRQQWFSKNCKPKNSYSTDNLIAQTQDFLKTTGNAMSIKHRESIIFCRKC